MLVYLVIEAATLIIYSEFCPGRYPIRNLMSRDQDEIVVKTSTNTLFGTNLQRTE